MRLNKKGFTLVELLAVIVILAVVMLIAVTSVGPMMEKSRKSSLGTEGLGMLDAAETAYQAEGLKGTSAAYSSTQDACYSLQYLCLMGYFEKGCEGVNTLGDKYTGSVYAHYANGKVSFSFWLSNGTYVYAPDNGTLKNTGVNTSTYGDYENTAVVQDDQGSGASNSCGQAVNGTNQIVGMAYCDCTDGSTTTPAAKTTCQCYKKA